MVANWWQDRRMIENYLKNENVEEISAADRSQQQIPADSSQQQRTEVKKYLEQKIIEIIRDSTFWMWFPNQFQLGTKSLELT